ARGLRADGVGQRISDGRAEHDAQPEHRGADGAKKYAAEHRRNGEPDHPALHDAPPHQPEHRRTPWLDSPRYVPRRPIEDELTGRPRATTPTADESPASRLNRQKSLRIDVFRLAFRTARDRRIDIELGLLLVFFSSQHFPRVLLVRRPHLQLDAAED